MRRRLLAFLLIPMLVLLLLDALLTYTVALSYSNHVHDRDLAGDAQSLAALLQHDAVPGEISSQARFLLDYDPDGRSYYSIRSRLHGPVSGNAALEMHGVQAHVDQAPTLFDSRLGHTPLRAATVAITDPRNPQDVLEITVAETLHDRHMVAREILLLSVPLQLLLIVLLLGLAWLGVNVGLRGLEPLTDRLARREHTLAPIDDSDVPKELLPLTRTIDNLFTRLRELMALQDRFIADAAHQLRTPLTGLALHVERAQAHANNPVLRDALHHIGRLNGRAARTARQLLALTRAQTPHPEDERMTTLDLATLLPDAVGDRVHEAIAAGVDLGYEGTTAPLQVRGNAGALRELLDNLLDNALRYTPREGSVTVRLHPADHEHGAGFSVEDDGPGVPDEWLPRLGERFFRVPSSHEDGTGLGLAIVQRIAERHAATVVYARSPSGGLLVNVHFPAAGIDA
ncbi:histidine kinase [Oleiagrimonas soli]|uniref:histidine kinase n=1 Tax=Oleiagrimonas soli TaxID=1543381 RepID=A0A099CX82_9GAMM|nr:histidine kinase [Oleiagrimonas soli]